MCELHYGRWARGDTDIDRPHRDETRLNACRVVGCTRPIAALGLCSMHRQRWMRGDRGAKLALPSRLEPKPSCKIAGCGRPFATKGYCNAHYVRWKAGQTGAKLARPIGPQVLRVPLQRGCPPARAIPHLAMLVHGPGWKPRRRPGGRRTTRGHPGNGSVDERRGSLHG